MILVTGGCGFIGLHTARSLVDRGESCVLTRFQVAREPSFIADELGERIFIEQLDVTDEAAFLALGEHYAIDGIVHLAVPGLAALTPFDDFTTNLSGMANALRAASAWDVRRISIASSITVYRGVTELPFREDQPLPLNSTSPTEAFKKSEEILAQHLAERAGIDCISLRIGYVYGPLYHSMANLPSRLVHAAVHRRPPDYSRGIPYAEDGGDFFYVRDCGEAIASLQTASELHHRVYNVASGTATRNADLVSAVKQVIPEADLQLNDGFDPRGPGFAGRLDTSRLSEDTGFIPRFGVQSAIADYVSWLEIGNEE